MTLHLGNSVMKAKYGVSGDSKPTKNFNTQIFGGFGILWSLDFSRTLYNDLNSIFRSLISYKSSKQDQQDS